VNPSTSPKKEEFYGLEDFCMFVYQVADVKAFPKKKSLVSLEDQFRFAVVFAAAELFIFFGGLVFGLNDPGVQ